MTSPAVRIDLTCPQCEHEYEAWYRPSINLTLGEEWSNERIEQAWSATCPECGFRVGLDTLIVEDTEDGTEVER